jgi:hypothetical protein
MKIMIKRIIHSTETEQKTAERYTINTTFKNDYGNYSMLLLPIPDFIEAECSMPECNKKAICMDSKSLRTFCSDCLNNQFPPQKMVQEKTLAVPSVGQAVRGNAFEWQLLGKSEWYKVRGNNIVWASKERISDLEMEQRWNDVMYKVLSDNPQIVEADYIREEKKLVILV